MPANGERAQDNVKAPSSDYSNAAMAAGTAFALGSILYQIVGTPDEGLHPTAGGIKRRCINFYRYVVGAQEEGTDTGEAVEANGNPIFDTGRAAEIRDDSETDDAVLELDLQASPAEPEAQQNQNAGREPVRDADPEPKIPDGFMCPISHGVMTNPVMTVDGHTYERFHIVQWLLEHDTSPLTNEKLESLQLKPNYALKKAIESWQARNQRAEAERSAVREAPAQFVP